MNTIEKIIKENSLGLDIKKGRFGIEKESLRVNENGELVLTNHPKFFGDKIKNPYITVDFSESQIEMITPTESSVEKAYDFLRNIHEIVATNLKDEYLWSQSVPPILPSEELIPLGKFPQNKELEKYREKLALKYGRKKQLLSGIHFNFSFDDEFLKELYELSKEKTSFKEFKNNIYLKISRNYFKYGWMIIYLLGASPVIHETYLQKCIDKMKKFTEDTYYFEDLVSFRNGSCGYRNEKDFFVNYESVDKYVESLERLIEKESISSAKEYYSPIRLKTKNPKEILLELKNSGIEYLEFRSIDLNPFSEIGIEKTDLEFLHLFILFLFLKDDEPFEEKDYFRYLKNQEILANKGNSDEFRLICCEDKNVSPKEYSIVILEEIERHLKAIGAFTNKDEKVLQYQKNKILSNRLYSDLVLKEVKQKGFVKFHIDKAKEFLNEMKKTPYTLKGFEDLELSTQILLKAAIKNGVKFEILDRDENFIVLEKDKKVEYVKQATKTSLDSYVTMLIMENKVVTKKVLEKENIIVPQGKDYFNIEEAKSDYRKYGAGIVIKPKSTNFGLGITIFKEEFSKEDYEKALEIAFKEDNSILIERFIKGKEYRIFVIGDEVVGILHRVPANVKGDGERSIKELVEEKNLDPLRGIGYKTPLEKIRLEDPEKLFLKGQGLTIEYIPKKDEVVYLRENSNISTGGDSLDYTDDILDAYKKIAIKASKAVGAKICGVDMMIEDIKNPNPIDNYAIIELNFNPAIHIHCYPYKGKNRNLGEKILKALGYIEE
ncbi:bifunctional glutamate--cysteine ligase GshA/glutathione synthetase GshB [Cetobacterium sp. 2G large]|uniref:bifunctional glutamate--cysteine ligase GshA/glutathione synthetase GshB n=1 Tax=Cetobacterium sp. 2G large TaxID=2759680 RepID=UPI00163CEC40|nr:bifunctional glutamate--cysteine ligase GshA/glutathione synthetase GshB [Cetobacterium sp. 2G large]MBC2853685.1 bifunctional glutamate--cysteine ligase GshA/glutathione synthetase GshB [Cetobacterium sp. 2G large]